jgi:hypothetical protein
MRFDLARRKRKKEFKVIDNLKLATTVISGVRWKCTAP